MKSLSKLTVGTPPLNSKLTYVWKMLRLCFIRREVALFLVYISALGSWSHQPGFGVASESAFKDDNVCVHEVFHWSAVYGTRNKKRHWEDRYVEQL